MVGLASRKTRWRYLDDETGSATTPLFVPHAAVVHIEEAGAEEEPKSEPLAPGTLRNERLEQALPDTLGNPWSVVLDAEDHFGSGAAVRFQPDPDRGVLTPFERVQGVAQQTADHFVHYMPGQVDAGDIGDFPHHSNSLVMGRRQECR
jgi:hypothetical protein